MIEQELPVLCGEPDQGNIASLFSPPRSSPNLWVQRCVTAQKPAARETKDDWLEVGFSQNAC